MQLDQSSVATYLQRIAKTGFEPSTYAVAEWRLTKHSPTSSAWEDYSSTVTDFSAGLFRSWSDIAQWDETKNLLTAIHHSTGASEADLPQVLVSAGAAYLREASSRNPGSIMESIAFEIEAACSTGLPARYRSYLVGIDVKDALKPTPEVTLRPFGIGDWPSFLNPSEPSSFLLLHSSILEIDGRMEAFGQPFDPFDERSYHWQKSLEQAIRILRLYRVGGVYSLRTLTIPTTLLVLPLHGGGLQGHALGGSPRYQVHASDEVSLAAHFRLLQDLPPWKLENLTHVDVAIERYEAAVSPMRRPEEAVLFAVMGLEALLKSRFEGRDGPVNRLSLLIGLLELGDPLRVREDWSTAYKLRNQFAHGDTIERDRAKALAEALPRLLDHLRLAILASKALQRDKDRIKSDLDDALFDAESRTRLERELRRLRDTFQLSGSPLPDDARS